MSYLLGTVRHIAMNPAKAGLCGDPAGWPSEDVAAGSVADVEVRRVVAVEALHPERQVLRGRADEEVVRGSPPRM